MDKRYDTRRSSVPSARRKRLLDLLEMGLPEGLAKAVAAEHLPLTDALEQMARAAQVERLVAKHGLARSVATQVAMGHIDLKKVLWKRRLKTYVASHRDDTCLKVGQRLAFATRDGTRRIGTIQAVSAYEMDMVDEKGGHHHLHKLELRYAYDADDWKRVRKGMRFGRSGDGDSGAPRKRPQHRYNCANEKLFRYLEEKHSLRVRILGGEELSGVLTWFAQYEFRLEMRSGARVTVFRHALSGVEML